MAVQRAIYPESSLRLGEYDLLGLIRERLCVHRHGKANQSNKHKAATSDKNWNRRCNIAECGNERCAER